MTRRRITVVASEILGVPGTGGPGTGDSLLAIALGRHGHDVELLVAPGRDVGRLGEEWSATYAAADVRIRPLSDDGSVRPAFLAPTARVYDALKRDPPDVVVADDWRALGYAPLRARQLGLAFPDTAFVLYCHGPARVFAAAAQKVPDTVDRFGEEVAQRACLELADAVVSPSAWLVDWMRDHRWPLRPPVQVIPNLLRSVALGQPAERAASAPIRRLAFFGQLREGKGIRVFLDSLRQVERSLLDGVEVLFLGHSRSWTEAQLRDQLAGVVESVRLETQLDQTGALEELKVPGTLAVMPSLLENSPYAVAECIEHGVPFLAADVGGTSDLVARDDRARVLSPPTAEGFASALTRLLASDVPPVVARPASEPERSLASWLDLVATVGPSQPVAAEPGTQVTVVALGDESRRRARTLAEHTKSAAVDVVEAERRADGIERAEADWVAFLDDEDEPDPGMLEALVRAQAASQADVVTAAVRPADDPDAVHLFLGDPGPLGLVENQYGLVGLVRRSLVAGQPWLDSGGDADWVLFARLALSGARIVSIPEPLSTHRASADGARETAAARLAVLDAFEAADSDSLHDLPQLTATLAAALARTETQAAAVPSRGMRARLAAAVRRLSR